MSDPAVEAANRAWMGHTHPLAQDIAEQGARAIRGELAPLLSDTSLARTAPPTEAAAPRSDRDEIAWIKEHSGLTWDQLGKVFGVSRRAVHMWANGGRLNETNARRLREFASIIQHLEVETPAATPEMIRARLNQVETDGYSILGRLRQERAGGPSWGAPFGPERLIDAIRSPLRGRVGEAGEALAPLRELHRPVNECCDECGGSRVCCECDWPWPCATAKLIYREDEL